MPTLDTKTIGLLAMITSLLLPLVLYAANQIGTTSSRAARTWTRGVSLYALGFLGLALRDVVPDLLSVVVANTLLVAGYCELLVGFRQFFHRRGDRRWEVAVIAFTALAFVWYGLIAPDFSLRVVLASAILTVISAAIAHELYRAARDHRRQTNTLAAQQWHLLATLSASFVLSSLSFAIRGFLSLESVGEAFMGDGAKRLYGASFILGVLINFMVAACLPLMISRRTLRELMDSRELLAQTEALALVGTLVARRGVRRLKVNAVLSDMLDIPPESDLSMESWLNRFQPQDRALIAPQIEAMMEGTRTGVTAEVRLLPSPGQGARWFSLRCGIRPNIAGADLFIASMRDITETKVAEERALLARDEADRANQAKSMFLANMSHEIRTPMNAVLGLTRLCLEGELGPKERNLIEKCHTSAQSLLGIVNDILDFSKIEAGKLQVEEAPFNLDMTLDNARSLFDELAGGKGLRFEVQVADDVPRGLLGDGLRLSQVLNNLLSNAVKFTAQGEVVLDITRDPQPAPDGRSRLRFQVRDTGIGMTAEQQARLFQPFTQADASITRKYGGSGLGLVIASRLVQLMEGELSVQSQEDMGSSFTVTLPFATSVQALSLSRPATSAVSRLQLRGIRVLLVEDNPTNVLVATLSLQGQGARVHHEENGQLAVEYLQRHAQDTDIVLMDIQMPVMDGYTAAREIRQTLQLSELPVVAMTANVMDSDREASMQAGMNAHVGKPFDMAQLIAVVLRLVQRVPVALPSGQDAPADLAPAQDSPPAAGVAESTPTPTTAALLDLAPALARLGGDAGLLAQVAHSFAQDLPSMLSSLGTAQEDHAPPAQVLHTIKGLAATVGLPRLSQAAAALERSVKGGSEATRAEIDALNELATQSVQALLQAVAAPQAPQAAPAVEAAPSTDTAEGRQALQELCALLHASDMGALAFAAAHRTALQGVLQSRLSDLDAAMQQLDFAAALRVCEAH